MEQHALMDNINVLAANVLSGHRPTSPQREQSIGRILLDSGKIKPEEAERVLRYQKEKGLRFGEAAKELGLVTEADIQQVLSHQFDYPYVVAGNTAFDQHLVAAYQPFSRQVEALRALRSQLLLRWFHAGHKTLAIVSVDADDGSSHLAANLAIVFSQLGERTLLIDANLRTPRQHELFKLGSQLGLSDMLAERTAESRVARIPSFVDLSILPAGTLPPNPQELLSRENFATLVAGMTHSYDIVLFDALPVNLGSDALTVAARAEGVLLLVRKDKTRLAEIDAMTEQFKGAGVEVVGCVVSAF